MMIHVSHEPLANTSADVLILGLFQGGTLTGFGAELDKELKGWVSSLLKEEKHEGSLGEWKMFPSFGKVKAKRIAVIGLGEKKDFTLDSARKIGAHMARHARAAKAKRVATCLHGSGAHDLSSRDLAEALVEGWLLGAYQFHVYKAKSKPKMKPTEVADLTFCDFDARVLSSAERGIREGELLASATILARDLVNTPSMEMHPERLVQAAKELVKSGARITAKVLDKAAMERLGMRAALAVSQGSLHPPVGIHMVYHPKPFGKLGAKKRIALVGKAITFDSGGLSIKPADAMTTMKCDMAGAAAVIGVFSLLAKLKISAEVHGVFFAMENMPSGHAYRPGDVVRAMNGTMIEVLNTDAEGRVVLADALSYASRQKPDQIVELSTLTGACVVALGDDMAAVMSNDEKLTQRLLEASEKSGEPLWELPLFAPYEELIKSKVGDIKNIGGRSAGAITAGLFLQHFVEKTPFAHVDIAGPAFLEKETRPDQFYGGSGYGVRLLARYLQGL